MSDLQSVIDKNDKINDEFLGDGTKVLDDVLLYAIRPTGISFESIGNFDRHILLFVFSLL